MLRATYLLKRQVLQDLGVDYLRQKSVWLNPYLREKLVENGFKINEEFFVAYKVQSDEYIFVGMETINEALEEPTGTIETNILKVTEDLKPADARHR